MVISMAVFSLLLLIIAWVIASNGTGTHLHRRHVASIIGFIIALVAIVLEGLTLKLKPNSYHYFSIQVVTLLGLMMSALSTGMNNVVVDLCLAGEKIVEVEGRHCGAHYVEFFGGLFLTISFASMFLCTQQKIITLVDRGILQGIGLRLSRT